MTIFLKYLGVLLAVLVSSLLVNDFACKEMTFAVSSNSGYKMWRLHKGYLKNEIAILGSSRALTSFLPSVLGGGFFNYGINGSGQNETVEHLEAVIARGENSPIIINLDPWGMRGDAKFADYSYVRCKSISEIPGVRSFGKTQKLLLAFLKYILGKSDLAVDNGASPFRTIRRSDEWPILENKLNPVSLKFSVKGDVLDKYARILSGRHPPIIFVLTPIQHSWIDRFNGMSELKKLEARLLSYHDVYLIDMLFDSDREKYVNELFYDVAHLNQDGAERFSREFRKRFELLHIK